MTTSFITTAIPYVNARPHLGFAYELVLADILARHRRRRGREVRFTTGTDDHSLKNVRAAARAGTTTRELVDRNAAAFRALAPLVGAAPDDFLATSRDPRHRPAVEQLWRACGRDLYKRAWHGRYCAGCEAFVDDDVALCPEHGTPPEPVSEDNWFFRLSRWRDPVRDAIRSGRLAIVPDAARAETLAFLDGEVRDLSVSRVAARAAGWGIPVPGDPSQVIYVWFDALASYLSALGLGGDDALYARYWRPERTHVIGKGITRFHAAYWPAFLLSAGLDLPDRIAVHGYLTVEGEKIRKSGRALEVEPFVARCGADALRWYFARCCRTRADTDVALAAVRDAYNREPCDRLGNLVQRCAGLAARVADGRVPPASDDPALRALAEALPARVDAAFDAFAPDDAAGAIVALLDAANRAIERAAPWRLPRDAAAAALYPPLEAARIAAGELAPIVPGVAATIAARLGGASLEPGWGRLVSGAALPAGSIVLDKIATTP
ncbi:MAG TPA: methionine--tRNA ligase [Kofleriaceae bacterium]|nr:methionine--tRNA ligase [Kofleriaceae bacterium]